MVTLNEGVFKVKYAKVMLVGLLAIIGLGYRSFGADAKNDLYKGIYYDNITYTDNIDFHSVDGVKLDYSAELSFPGDYYELSFDVVNSTKYDVCISDYIYNQDDDYIGYELTYDDGNKIEIGDTIKQGESIRIKYKVLYKKLIQDEYKLDTNFSILYQQVI